MSKQKKSIIPEKLVSGLAEAVIPITPPESRAVELKSRVMARIKGKKSFDLMTIRTGEGEWVTLLPGVEKKILSNNSKDQVQSFLLRMAPGSTLAAHEHLYDEECLMLEGEVMIGDLDLSAGDYHFARKGSKHEQVTTKTGALAFLRAYEPLLEV